jgi:molecular chaperone GrpE
MEPNQPPPEPKPETRDISDMVDDAAALYDELEKRGAELAARTAELTEERNKYLRLAADYQNSQRRSLQNEQIAKSQGAASVAMSVVNVIDHFDVALNQDLSKATPRQLVDGVRVIREELIKALSQHGVGFINPVRGEAFSPGRHEAVMQQPADDLPGGSIVQTFQNGYTLATPSGERVLRAAKVSVTPAG